MQLLIPFFCFFVSAFCSQKQQVCDSKKNKINCDGDKPQKKIAWHKFDWKSYIQKDVKSEDYTNPTNRFGIHLLNSIKIGVNRTVPDNRNPICAKTDWDEKTKGNPYPDVSVIITYRDEPRSTLLRTVVSVLERSSKELIKEIILVDDNNDDITIGQELKIIKKVKVIRNENRLCTK